MWICVWGISRLELSWLNGIPSNVIDKIVSLRVEMLASKKVAEKILPSDCAKCAYAECLEVRGLLLAVLRAVNSLQHR